MSAQESNGPVAVLMYPKQTHAFITFAHAVHNAMAQNLKLPKPTPDLATVAADIAALEDAENKAATKAKGTIAVRNAKQKKVVFDLQHLRDYVQSVAETQSSPADAVAVIESAFMTVRKPPVRSKPPIEARNNGAAGSVILIAKALAPATTYFWEHSQDQITWTSLPPTMKSRTTASGLASAHTYAFRFKALTPKGPIDYSQVVSLLVH
ncbi:MAG: hypothetical protein U0359_02555 [Byssovorax sp.]